MVARVSTAGSLVQNLFSLRQNQNSFDLLSFRVSTGKKFQELRDYGNDGTRIVDLKQEIKSREAYIRSGDIVEITAKAYDTTLNALAELTQDLLNAADPISTQEPNWAADNLVIANNLLLEVEANMNLEIAGRFIYSGANFTQAPVVDMRTLNVYAATEIGTANAIETRPTVPEMIFDSAGPSAQSYHTSYGGSGSINTNAYEESNVTLSDSQAVSYGITATEPAFQNLIDSVFRFKSATQAGLTQDQRRSFLTEARNLANTARDQLRQLQASNGVVLNEVSGARDLHVNFINISQTALTTIEGTDTAAAATELSTLQTQIQASFATISKRSELSLVNFLR